MEAQYICRYHKHQPSERQCSSSVVKHIKAPVDIVWSLVRRFDQPQKYKPFVSRTTASIITRPSETIDGRPGTLVIESFVVDVRRNTQDEACYFVNALINCNLKSLADVSERMAMQGRFEPVSRLL
ncbi:hypothetical protein DH2020_029169 [Rehmannia glutinosa]|uniref:Abscisic acid receptor n=1 Tax=Rehmannia glutinosa TaxID=99300 RepID=A0ABR0VPD0_REHGL